MKPLIIVFSILLFASFAPAQPSIKISDVDRLRLSVPLSELLQYLKSKLPHDEPILRERSLGVIKTYYNFQAAKKELQLLNIECDNLRAIYDLHIKKQKAAQVSDLDVLQSHNALLAKELAIVSKQSESRNYIIEIARLCNIRIEYNGHKTPKDSISKRD